MQNIDELIDINQRKGLPRTYYFNRFMRWFTIFFASVAIAYALWLIIGKINADSSKFVKFVPFAIMFLALNSLLKNLFSLNSILFTKEYIKFKFLAKKGRKIFWNNITKIDLNDDRRKMIRIYYQEDGTEKTFQFPIAFPKMLEIINSIAEMVENVEYDEFVQNVIISKAEKDKVTNHNADKE